MATVPIRHPGDSLAKRYSDELLTNAYHSRDMFHIGMFGAILVAVIAVCGCVYLGGSVKRVPMVWVESTDGNFRYAGNPSEAAMSPAMKDAALKSVFNTLVYDWRYVSIDQALMQKFVDYVTHHIASGSQAEQFMDLWYASHQPESRAGKEQVEISITSSQRVSDNTWRVEWDEATKKNNSSDVSRGTWAVIFTFVTLDKVSDKPNDPNPLGIKINQISPPQQVTNR